MNDFWELIKRYRIAIPMIQRDYAHGRPGEKTAKVRGMLLDALINALKDGGQPLELDFVYGYVQPGQSDSDKEVEIFYPLDGQQRLTTLFLLHWYVAIKEGRFDEASGILKRFSYETRHQTKVFCESLCEECPEINGEAVSKAIINRPWFLISWKNDPTIRSMLVMLDAIQKRVDAIPETDLWEKLTRETPPITFQLLHMDQLNLPDELYIKMNSRGKELTEFEYFKARFSDTLDAAAAEQFIYKIDREWQDLFWNLYKNQTSNGVADLVDAGFLRFMRFITNMLTAGTEAAEKPQDEYEWYQKVYADPQKVEFLFAALDALHRQNTQNPQFFENAFITEANAVDSQKTRIFFVNPNANLLKKCADAYDTTQRNNPFSIGEQLLLYGCILHLIHQSQDFHNRIRMLRNLISNSEDTVRNQYMATHLKDVEGIILRGEILPESEFSKSQIKEENEKRRYLSEKPNLAETVRRLEDHELLQGCIALFGLDEDIEKYAAGFMELFSPGCNFVLISRALLTFGDYSQHIRWRVLLGNRLPTTWRMLFTPSQSRAGFEQTTKILYAILDYLNEHPGMKLEDIVEQYLTAHQATGVKKDWGYYFIQYKAFRYHSEGFYYWPKDDHQYQCLMMSKTNLNGYNWDPFLVAIKEGCADLPLGLENFGHPLVLTTPGGSLAIRTEANGFRFEALDTGGDNLLKKARRKNILSPDSVLEIMQSDDGVDLEDRVVAGCKALKLVCKIAV